MKYFITALIAMPLLGSCTVVEERYYEPRYYTPPTRVEIIPDNQPRYYRHGNYHPAPRGPVYHGHARAGSTAVVVNPRAPRSQIRPQNNVHGHAPSQANVHGHDDAPAPIVKQAITPGAASVNQSNTHGHH